MKSKLKFKSNKNFFILIISVLILFFIYISLTILNNKFKSINKISNISSNINNEGKMETINIVENNEHEDNEKNYKYEVITNSTITIPSILLYNVPIKKGIDELTLNEYVGRFPSTSEIDGNVGLAAHNRGYKNNYFMNINKLQNGDEIIYKFNNISRRYKVEKKIEIDSYDWSYLNSTNDNRITLITCIDDKPDKRLVVQAVE